MAIRASSTQSFSYARLQAAEVDFEAGALVFVPTGCLPCVGTFGWVTSRMVSQESGSFLGWIVIEPSTQGGHAVWRAVEGDETLAGLLESLAGIEPVVVGRRHRARGNRPGRLARPAALMAANLAGLQSELATALATLRRAAGVLD